MLQSTDSIRSAPSATWIALDEMHPHTRCAALGMVDLLELQQVSIASDKVISLPYQSVRQ